MALAHHHLVAWQRADDLFIEIHRLTHQRFPTSERYELGSQLRRSAYSVPANMVEGIAREYRRDSLRFFHIAAASLNEVGYGVHAAKRLGYIDSGTSAELEGKVAMIAGPLRGLIRRYRRRAIVQASAVLLMVIGLLIAA